MTFLCLLFDLVALIVVVVFFFDLVHFRSFYPVLSVILLVLLFIISLSLFLFAHPFLVLFFSFLFLAVSDITQSVYPCSAPDAIKLAGLFFNPLF